MTHKSKITRAISQKSKLWGVIGHFKPNF